MPANSIGCRQFNALKKINEIASPGNRPKVWDEPELPCDEIDSGRRAARFVAFCSTTKTACGESKCMGERHFADFRV
jgi:hypothetical protein